MTQIFETYEDFLQREDKRVNGVSRALSYLNPNWESDNSTNIGCWECLYCEDCTDCINCEDCTESKGLVSCYSVRGFDLTTAKIPVIENIHQRVFEAVCKPGALNMGSWHECKTTHCRAGWVTTLAGAAGIELEDRIGTPLAALAIYKASSDIPVKRDEFFTTNEQALESMRICAELEKAAKA